MIAAWMFYGLLWTLWAGAAAWMIERTLLLGRVPIRAVWIAAMLIGVAAPALEYTFADRSSLVIAAPVSAETMRVAGAVSVHSSPPVASVAHHDFRATINRVAARSDGLLAVVWVCMSLAVVVYWAGGLARLHFLRRGWRRDVVAGVEVLVSEDTGPALVGVLRGSIVVPEWVTGLDPKALSLVMRHELEHQRAGDARLLALAQLLVAAVPWNLVLWWQFRRLRLAVELDCDARVLRTAPDVRLYGRLLLDVGRPRRATGFVGAALADHATHLEQRILAMARGRQRGAKHGVVLALSAGALAVFLGCQMPVPPRPAGPVSAAPPVTRPSTDSTSIRSAAADSASSRRPRQTRDSIDVAIDSVSDSSRARRRALNVINRRDDSVNFNRSVGDRASDSVSKTRRRDEPNDIETKLDRSAPVGDSLLYAKLRRQVEDMDQLMRDLRGGGLQSDSADAERRSAGCSAGVGTSDSVIVRLLIPEADVRRGGTVTIVSSGNRRRGALVGYADAAAGTCETTNSGLLRIFGAGAVTGRTIAIDWRTPTVVIVANGSGRVLAGPIALTTASREFQMTWRAP